MCFPSNPRPSLAASPPCNMQPDAATNGTVNSTVVSSPKCLRETAYDATFVISNAVGTTCSEKGTRLRSVGGVSVQHMHEAASPADEICLDGIGSFCLRDRQLASLCSISSHTGAHAASDGFLQPRTAGRYAFRPKEASTQDRHLLGQWPVVGCRSRSSLPNRATSLARIEWWCFRGMSATVAAAE